MAAPFTWSDGASLEQGPVRRYAFAFADLRRACADDLAAMGFGVDCRDPDFGTRIPLIAAVIELVE